MPAAIAAATTMVLCVIFHIKIPAKIYFLTAYVAYLSLIVTTALLIMDTGDIASPFIALWMLVSLFASIFGFLGILPLLLPVAGFTAFQYIQGDIMSTETIIIIIACGLLPIIASLIIWHEGKAAKKNEPDGNYRNINKELDKITAKSDIVINAIGDGVIIINNLGNIKLINPAAQNMTGWSESDAISLNYKSVLNLINSSNNSIDSPNNPIDQVLNLNQQMRTRDFGLETKHGKKIQISLVVSPIGEAGSGVIAVFSDITKEKKEGREQAEFISTASHEMRTPVAAIEGYLGLALNPQTATIDIRARDYINNAHKSSQHLGRLFKDLLDVSKADDNRLSNHPQLVNVVNFTNEIIKDHIMGATQKGLRLIFKPNPGSSNEKYIAPEYSVNLDNSHIREVVNNLIENAIKYSNKGDIVVDVMGNDDNVVISVKDSGIGIPAEDMPHLFQKFYRIDNKDTREINGTGLGLYLSRKLTESMGGRIWAESVKDIGSTFYVQLPRISSQQAKMLKEQQLINPNAQNPNLTTQQPTIAPQQHAPQTMDIVKSPNSVPRGQALTPEQIAAYAAKQHVLAQQQPNPTVLPTQPVAPRAQALNVPRRPTN